MAAQRRIDVVLDSVKRLLRIGATANLLNLLQKQHPADLAQIFGSMLDTERQAVFALLVERNGRLAMETVSEMGPEAGAKLLTSRSAEEVAKLLQEIASDASLSRDHWVNAGGRSASALRRPPRNAAVAAEYRSLSFRSDSMASGVAGLTVMPANTP